jgi:hypothetical protein
MIEIKFNRQHLKGWDKESYTRILREIIAQIFLFNKGTRLLKSDVRIEIKIIFK